MRTQTIRKALIVACVGAFATVVGTGGETTQIEVGDARKTVREALGTPKNYAKLGEKEFLYYKLGSVVIKEGEVSEVNLISAETYKAREKAKKQYAKQQKQERKAEREMAIKRAQQRRAEAKARVLEADAELAELNVDRAEYRFHREVLEGRSVVPAVLGSPIQRYQRVIRAHRLERSFLKPRVGFPHSYPRFFSPYCGGSAPPHLYRHYR